MNIKEKILALPNPYEDYSRYGCWNEALRQSSELAQKEMDALIAELRGVPVHHPETANALIGLIDKWSTK